MKMILTFLQRGWGVGRDEIKSYQFYFVKYKNWPGFSSISQVAYIFIYICVCMSEVIISNQQVLHDCTINNLCNPPFNKIFSVLDIVFINSTSPFYFSSAVFYFSCKLDSFIR